VRGGVSGMATMRVFELARKLKISSKELLAKLKEMKINASSHMASLKDVDVNKVEKSLAAGTKTLEKPKPKPKKTAQKGGVAQAPRRKAGARKPGVKARPARTRTRARPRPVVTERSEEEPAGAVAQATAVVEAAPARVEPVVERPVTPPLVVAPAPVKPTKSLELDEATTVGELAEKLGIALNQLILELMDFEILASKNQVLDIQTVRKVAQKHGFAVHFATSEEAMLLEEEADDVALLQRRAPVVTLMGHVDHGKTSLLDVIRESHVVETESGRITQHIGAYEVTTAHGRLVFLDTPGHEAFTAMRARGARVTDVVVLVVAADDGVMPQTVEAINHARAAEVAIVVALNKVDKPEANPSRVRQQLMQFNLISEEWGGRTITVEVSAKTAQGLNELLEMLLLEGELLDLRANPQKRARGVVLESKLDKRRGALVTVLVQNGSLKVGDPFVGGIRSGKVRALFNDRGASVTEVGPSTPVEVLGFDGLPEAGDMFVVVADERKARQVSDQRRMRQRETMVAPVRHVTLDDLYARIQEGQLAQLNVIVKADVYGSVDVLVTALNKLGTDEVKLNALHSGVGGINESDVLLASASDAIIIGYHVTASARAKKMAEDHGVDIRTYRVIYEAVDAVKAAMAGLLKPQYREEITGRAEVRQIFNISGIGTVAGCYVQEGELTRGQQARLVRDGVIAYEGRINTLRRFKQDVRSVQSGYECGLTLENFGDVHAGDAIEAFTVIQIERTL